MRRDLLVFMLAVGGWVMEVQALDASGWRERLDAEQQTWVAAHVKGAEHIGQLLQAGRQGRCDVTAMS